MEESRKRKRGNEEVGNIEHKAGDWVSDMAYIAWRDKLQHKDFIGEKGFNKWVSPFQELVESKGWHLFCENKAPGFVDVVKELYANMVGMKDKVVYLARGLDEEVWPPRVFSMSGMDEERVSQAQLAVSGRIGLSQGRVTQGRGK